MNKIDEENNFVPTLREALNHILSIYGIEDCYTKVLLSEFENYIELVEEIATFKTILLSNKQYEKLTGRKIPEIRFVGEEENE